MNAKLFKQRAEGLIIRLQCLIDKVPQKGDTADECQKINLQQHLNEFEYAVNGVENSDFIEDEELNN